MTCQGCDTPIDQPTRGRRKWCSDKCRKITLYSRSCIDCGAVCNTDGRVTSPSLRCAACDAEYRHRPEVRLSRGNKGALTWSKADIIAALRFAADDSGWLTTTMYHAAYLAAGPGTMPSRPTIFARFDKWCLALKAAGLRGGTPRQRERLTAESCLLAVEDCADVIGRLPSAREYKKWAQETGAPSGSIVRVRCGNWGNGTRALLNRQSAEVAA